MDSVFLFFLTLLMLLAAAYGGKFIFKRRLERAEVEDDEASVLGPALQRSQLLPTAEQEAAEELLQQYLAARIGFFDSGAGPEHERWGARSVQLQGQLWALATQYAKQRPDSISASVLTAYGDLYQTQLRTQASWRHRIPALGWWVILSFAFFANGLIGYNIRGIKGENLLVIILPVLTTAAFYLISDIDIPGAGLIKVRPEALQHLQLITGY